LGMSPKPARGRRGKALCEWGIGVTGHHWEKKKRETAPGERPSLCGTGATTGRTGGEDSLIRLGGVVCGVGRQDQKKERASGGHAPEVQKNHMQAQNVHGLTKRGVVL